MKLNFKKIFLYQAFFLLSFIFTSCDVFLNLLESLTSDDEITYGLESPITDLTVDSTTRKFYIDNNSELNTFKLTQGTLRAKNEKCLVWVIDSNYSSYTSTGKYVSSALAKKVADIFAQYCDYERAVFGNECEYLISTGNYLYSDSMKKNCATSSYVNIVIYDIGNDYSVTSNGGTVGYFYSKDYWVKANYDSAKKYSNAGKYFYLDAPWLNYNSDMGNYLGNSDKPSSTSILTLFHEFQHMIHFNMKGISPQEENTLDSDNESYTPSSEYVKNVDNTNGSITLSNVKGKQILYSVFNNSNKEIASSDSAYMSSRTNIYSSSKIKTLSSESELSLLSREALVQENQRKYFVDPLNFVIENNKARALQVSDESETWFNEMLSMLAEDMMNTMLGFDEDDSVWKERLTALNYRYINSGIDEYNSNNVLASYAMSYGFGAWFARQYGGAELIGHTSKNQYANINAMRAAVKKMGESVPSSQQMFSEYIQSLAFRPTFAAKNNLPTLKKAASNDITYGSYTSSMPAVDAHSYKVKNSFYGPAIYKSDVQVAIRPHGFILHEAGLASSDSVTLTFNIPKEYASSQIITVYIQDAFSNTSAD